MQHSICTAQHPAKASPTHFCIKVTTNNKHCVDFIVTIGNSLKRYTPFNANSIQERCSSANPVPVESDSKASSHSLDCHAAACRSVHAALHMHACTCSLAPNCTGQQAAAAASAAFRHAVLAYAIRRRPVVAPPDAAFTELEEAMSDFFWVARFMAYTLRSRHGGAFSLHVKVQSPEGEFVFHNLKAVG